MPAFPAAPSQHPEHCSLSDAGKGATGSWTTMGRCSSQQSSTPKRAPCPYEKGTIFPSTFLDWSVPALLLNQHLSLCPSVLIHLTWESENKAGALFTLSPISRVDSLHVADGCSSTLPLQTPNEMGIPYLPLKHELQDRTTLAQGNYNDFSTEIFLTKLTSSIKVQKGTQGRDINLLTQTVTVIEDFGIIFFTTALKKKNTSHNWTADQFYSLY